MTILVSNIKSSEDNRTEEHCVTILDVDKGHRGTTGVIEKEKYPVISARILCTIELSSDFEDRGQKNLRLDYRFSG